MCVEYTAPVPALVLVLYRYVLCNENSSGSPRTETRPLGGWRRRLSTHTSVYAGDRVQPRDLVRKWVEIFNRGNADALAALYAPDAVNHQVVREPVVGREAIRAMFADEFAAADMTCEIERVFQDGDWAILEWKDPNGLRGCGFFNVVDDLIVFQRGYFDELSFLRRQGLPLPAE